jgi:hypothetical protein
LDDEQLQQLHSDAAGDSNGDAAPPFERTSQSNIVPTESAPAERNPTEQEQLRSLAEEDMVLEVGNEQRDDYGELERLEPWAIAAALAGQRIIEQGAPPFRAGLNPRAGRGMGRDTVALPYNSVVVVWKRERQRNQPGEETKVTRLPQQ